MGRWLNIIEAEAEKGHVTDFDRNEYFTYDQKDKYPEDFTDGEEPTWWVMGATKTEPPQKSERQQQSSSSRPQHGQQTAGGSYPQQGATSGRASADDPNKIDNEIIDSIFRMNSGGDDDRSEIGDITSGYETYTSFEGGVTLGGAAVSVKFTINANTGYPIVQTVFGPCLIEGKDATFWECMLRNLTSSLLHFEEKTRADLKHVIPRHKKIIYMKRQCSMNLSILGIVTRNRIHKVINCSFEIESCG